MRCRLPGCTKDADAEFFAGYCCGPHKWYHDRDRATVREIERRASVFNGAPMNSYAAGERSALIDVAADITTGDFYA